VSSRIGRGPWARSLGTVLVPDDSTAEAIHGEELWRQGAVEDLRVETGQITARVEGCTVTITAPTIPPRIWDAMVRYAQNRGPLERAVRGETQSVQLEHLLAQDWDEPLVPPRDRLLVTCSCDADAICVHVATAANAVAARVDAEPGQLLQWRTGVDVAQPRVAPSAAGDDEAWQGGALPAASPNDGRRQTESVPRRLGPAGIRVGEPDLVDVLGEAYAAFGIRG